MSRNWTRDHQLQIFCEGKVTVESLRELLSLYPLHDQKDYYDVPLSLTPLIRAIGSAKDNAAVGNFVYDLLCSYPDLYGPDTCYYVCLNMYTHDAVVMSAIKTHINYGWSLTSTERAIMDLIVVYCSREVILSVAQMVPITNRTVRFENSPFNPKNPNFSSFSTEYILRVRFGFGVTPEDEPLMITDRSLGLDKGNVFDAYAHTVEP